jgi:hypothetical protein
MNQQVRSGKAAEERELARPSETGSRKERVWVDAKTCWLCFGSTFVVFGCTMEFVAICRSYQIHGIFISIVAFGTQGFLHPISRKKRNFLTLKQEGELDLGG